MKQILLVRHGRTMTNEKALYCGISDVELSEKGTKMLLEKRPIYEKFKSVKPKYFTSGMKRTNETLKILFGEDGNSPEFNVDRGFSEIDFGKFELHSYEELKDDKDYITWISGEFEKNVPPGGESGEQMMNRVVDSFERIVNTVLLNEESVSNDSLIVIVCHGGTIYCIMHYLFPDEGKSIYEWQPAGGNGYLLTLCDDGSTWSYEPIGS